MDPDNEEMVEEHGQAVPAVHSLPHDSMVTVRLSEPQPLSAMIPQTELPVAESGVEDAETDSGLEHNLLPTRYAEVVSDIEEEEEQGEQQKQDINVEATMAEPAGNEISSPTGSNSAPSDSRRGSESSGGSEEGGGVDWEELEKTEEQEPRDEGSDDVSRENQ